MAAAASISAVLRTACRYVPSVTRSSVPAPAAVSSAAMCSRSHCSWPTARAASSASTIAAAEAATVDRITDGTRRHAVRRTAEMEAAAEMLTELGVPPLMAEASRALHERLADET